MQQTSIEAGNSIRPGLAHSMQKVIMDELRVSPGTCDEMEVLTGYKHQTTSARIRELALANRIINSGTTRLTRGGRNAIVWQIVP